MNALLDESLVGLMLILSIGYAFAKLGPRNARRRVLALLGAILERAPTQLRLRSLAQRLADAADVKAGACGGCETCGAEAASPPAAKEISVPVASIRRIRPSVEVNR